MAVAREEPHQNAVAPDSPVIGIYGKVGITKGTFDLITALGRLAADGLKFRLAAMVGEPQGKDIEIELREAGILDRAYVLPLLPNWRVPEFLRTCAVVCFLERDFPVAIHGPVIPREVMARGSCLVLSREITSKQRYRDDLDHGRNCLIVEDPKDHDELTSVLRRILSEPQLARNLGAAGAVSSPSIEGEDRYPANGKRCWVGIAAEPQPLPLPASKASSGSCRILRRSCVRSTPRFCPASPTTHPNRRSAER